MPYPKEHGQGVKILKMMTKNLAKSDKKWGEGVKIGVGGNEAFEPVRSGEPQKSPRGVEKKNRVAKNCIQYKINNFGLRPNGEPQKSSFERSEGGAKLQKKSTQLGQIWPHQNT